MIYLVLLGAAPSATRAATSGGATSRPPAIVAVPKSIASAPGQVNLTVVQQVPPVNKVTVLHTGGAAGATGKITPAVLAAAVQPRPNTTTRIIRPPSAQTYPVTIRAPPALSPQVRKNQQIKKS